MVSLWRYLVSLFILGVVGLVPLNQGGSPSALAEPSQLLLRNAALILTMDPSLGNGPLGLLREKDLLISGDKVEALGSNLKSSGQTLDVTGKIVMPGFVDVHNHLWQTIIRGCGTDQDLIGWLETCTFPLAKYPFTQSEIAAAVRLSTLDLIDTGVTTVVDWSLAWNSPFVQGNVQSLLDSGLRFSYAYVTRGDPGTRQTVQQLFREVIAPHPRASLQIGSHPSMNDGWLPSVVAMSKLARELGVPFHVHLLEHDSQRKEEPIAALQRAEALGPDLLAAHAIHLTPDEITLLAQKGVRVAHCPLSAMRLASGVMKLPAMKAAGIPVGLGLDGGTNDTSDMFNNMRAAIGLQRVLSLKPKGYPTVVDVLRLATIGGAKVLKMEDQIGSLTPGKKADLIIIDPEAVNFGPHVDWISQIVFNGQPRNVEWVFVDGQALKARGKIPGVNPASLMATVSATAKKVRQFLSRRDSQE